VNPSWYNGPTPPSGQSVASSGLTISPDSLIDFRNSTLTNVSSILATNGLWSLSSDGTLVVQRVEAREVVSEKVGVRQASDTDKTFGSGVIPAGYINMVVQNPNAHKNSLIFVTLEGNPGSAWWISEKQEGSFTITFAAHVGVEIPFTYWIVGVEGELYPQPTDSGSGTSEIPPPSTEPPPTESGSGTPETPPSTEPPPTESGSSTEAI
jgi:hypothetical protein